MARRKNSSQPAAPTIGQDTSSVAESGGEPSLNFWVIGVGSSAGGLEALTSFLRPLPETFAAAVVVVQHMSHTHRSLLVQLLARETRLSVVEIKNGMQPRRGMVHIGPPKFNVELRDGHFRLVAAGTARVPTPSVDAFFLSLADACGHHGVGVILSGTGSDGAQGLRAVKLGGGYTYAQDPGSARYDGMPMAAIDTGVVDGILPVDQLAEEIIRLIHTGEAMKALPPASPSTPMLNLMTQVRRRTGVDLSGYKENTILRRLSRRMVAQRSANLDEYLALIEKQPEELDRLLQETLISVTSFFRDAPAYEALARAIERILDERGSAEEIRVWVAGCATGEEAYSISILFAEALARRQRAQRVRIFATDIDTNALQIARRGLYPASALAKVAAERYRDYFVETAQGLEVKRSIRDPITFARHDLIADPPFLRADLVCCRNLLIYFQPSLQAKVFPVLRYAMSTPGYLFLGKSESVSQFEDLFEVFDKAARVYRSRGPRLSPPSTSLGSPRLDALRKLPPRVPSIGENHSRALLDHYAPPSVLIDRDGQILHSMGDLSAFLSFPVGVPNLNVATVIRKDLATVLQTLLHRAVREQADVVGQAFETQGGKMFRIAVHPGRDGGSDRYLVAFVPAPPMLLATDPGTDPSAASSSRVLREELAATRENLQTVIEELETSNEEMQALNEELQSTNEELQSTNEELETSNEELQSTNEELNSVNDELQRSAQEVAEANADLLSVLQSLTHPVLLFDESLRVSRYNAAAEHLFHIPLHGAGVGLDSLAIPTWMAGLADLLEGAMRSGEPLRRQLDEGMRHFMLSIQPCRLPSHESHGLLLQVDDISPFIVVQNDLRRSKTQLESILDSSAIHSVITNHAGRVEFASRGMTEWMDVPAQRLVGSVIWSHFDDASARLLRQRHAAAMASDNVVEFEEIIAAAGGTFRVLSVRVPLMDDAGNVNGVCWQVLDVSERERISKALADSEALSRAVLTAMPANIAVLDAGGRIVSVNEAWTRFAESNGAAATTWEGVDYLAYCDRPDAGPDHGGSLAAGIREVLEGRRDLFMHEYPCHSAEQQHWFRLLAAPLRTETGGAAVMHVDVTQTVAAQQALKAVNASLEARIEGRTRDLRQAVDELEMFSYSVSHDLRTPLRTLNGFSEILLKDHAANLDATGQSHLRRIAAAAARMSQYLDELLKLSHLTKGDLVIERVDLSAMVREIGNDEVARYPDRKTEFTVAEGLAADGDPDLVRAVLENLVGNAFKYTVGRNPTRITVGKLVHDGTEMFYVRDNGMGFDMSFRDKLFMPFQRLHSNVEIPGNGLGLAAAKRIVMRHGGQIFAEARPGFGATFYFTLR